jgi:hypothetical protein
MERYYNRLCQMGWTLLNTGTLSIALPNGSIGYVASYTQQTYTPTTPWTTKATATPIQDMMKLQTQFGRGTINNFGATAKAYANSRTLQDALLNTNATDAGGKRVNNSTVTSLPELNAIMLAAGCPQFEIWDGSHDDGAGNTVMDIPDGTIHVIAARPGANATIGKTLMTKNANNPGQAPGLYHKIIDRTKGPYPSIPPKIENHCGFNGGSVPINTSMHVKMIVGTTYA